MSQNINVPLNLNNNVTITSDATLTIIDPKSNKVTLTANQLKTILGNL